MVLYNNLYVFFLIVTDGIYRQLMHLVTTKIVTVRARTEQSLKERTSAIDLSYKDQKLINVISKYFVLGATSFFTTLLVLIAMVLQFLELDRFHNKNDKIMLHVLELLVMVDVVTNILCIYLQYNFAQIKYKQICGYFDRKVRSKLHDVAVKKLRSDTFTFYSDKFKDSLHKSKHSQTVSLGDLAMDLPPTTLTSIPTTSQTILDEVPAPVTTLKDRRTSSGESIIKKSDHIPHISMDFDKLLVINETDGAKKMVEDEQGGIQSGNERDDMRKRMMHQLEKVVSGSENYDSGGDIQVQIDLINNKNERTSNAMTESNPADISTLSISVSPGSLETDEIDVGVGVDVDRGSGNHYRIDTKEMETALDIFDEMERVPSTRL